MSKKLAIVTPIYPPEIGGPATFSQKFGHYLAGKHESFRLFGKFGEGCGEDWYELIDKGHNRLTRLQSFLAFARQLKHYESILAINMEQELAFAHRSHRLNYIVKVPGDPIWEDAYARGWTKSTLDDFHQERSYRPRVCWRKYWRHKYFLGARRIVAPSHYLKNVIQKSYPSKAPLSVLPNAISFSMSAEEAQALSASKKKAARVLWLGRLINYKRPEMVFALAKAFPSLQFDMAGSGPMEAFVQDQVKHHENVQFLGKVSAKALFREKRHDIYLNTSLYEGYPHAALEAMASGLLVLASSNGGCKEVLSEWGGGIVTDTLDENALHESMQALLDQYADLPRVDQQLLRDKHDEAKLFPKLLEWLKQG